MKRVITSYPAMVILLAGYAVAMAVATFVENSYGTAVARAWIYHNGWFAAWQLLLVANFVGVALRRGLLRQGKYAAFLFHIAFAIILMGAGVTHWTGKEGMLHIREGERSDAMLDPAHPGKVIETLPFQVELTDFRLVRYPGSNSPSGYESDLVIRQAGKSDRHEAIYMNNVVQVEAYRLFQTSYDPDEQGTVLTVNKDRWGMLITYAGYVLLLGGMVVALFHRNSRFRVLGRSLGKGLTAIAILSLSLGSAAGQSSPPQAAQAAAQTPPHRPQAPQARSFDRQQQKRVAEVYATDGAVDKAVAQAFGRLVVQPGRGRVEPVDTYAAELLRKIYGGGSYQGLTPDQVLLGVVMQPNVWSRVPFIRVGSDRLRAQAGGGNQQGYLAFIDVLDDEGDYLFADAVDQVYAKPARQRDKYDKELLKLDERINILMGLFQGRLLPILPNDRDGRWYSPGDDLSAFEGQDSMFVGRIFPWFATESLRVIHQGGGDWSTPLEVAGMLATYQGAKAGGMAGLDPGRIEAEMLYNRLGVFRWGGYGWMTVGLLLLLALSVFSEPRGGRTQKYIIGGLAAIGVGLFLWVSLGVGLRWYIAGRPPVSNAYESMIFVGWAAAAAGLCFLRRSRMTYAAATFLAGVLLFVSNLNWMDPQITPLVPVLKSPWLMIHVATITASYGFFGIGFLLGLMVLILTAFGNSGRDRVQRQLHELTTINEMLLILGLVFLTAGTFIGAVWANESWGRYWGWDPKETWALITLVLYALVTHARFIPAIGSSRNYPYAFGLMSVVALGSVLMTFFGVNYFLGGMHSYGGDAMPVGLHLVWIVYGLVALLALLAWRKR